MIAALPARFARLVKVEHTVFALPFAYVGAFLAVGRTPTAHDLLWITLAMVGARSLAMALNRLIDVGVDARNPRTAGRELPSGQLSIVQVVLFCAASLALFLVAVWQLAPRTHWLWPIPVAGFVIYPYLKRWTWLCHFWLGAVDGLAPIGAWVAITNRLPWQSWVLGAAVAFWVAGFAACVALYFYGFRRLPYLPSTSEAFAHPLSAVAYFLAWLGAPLTGNNRYLAPVAAVIGLVLTVLFISAWLFRVRYSGDRALKRSLTCWLMIGTYSFMTAGLVTLGRLGYGVNQSLSSRYTTFSLYLIVSLIHVGMIARGRSKAKLAKGTRLRATRPLIAPTALVVLYMLASAISIRAIYQLHTRVMQEKACLLFVNVIAEACGPPDVTAVPDKLAERLNALDAMGFLRPGLVKSRSARDFAGGGKAGSSSGSFDRLSRNGGEFVAAGRAALPYRREPPDAVLLTYKTETGEAVLFSIAEMNYKGDILKRILVRDADYAFRWQKTFSEESLPPDAVGVSAWAFDADTGKAYELDGEHTLR